MALFSHCRWTAYSACGASPSLNDLNRDAEYTGGAEVSF
jgi:hypothetical protein